MRFRALFHPGLCYPALAAFYTTKLQANLAASHAGLNNLKEKLRVHLLFFSRFSGKMEPVGC